MLADEIYSRNLYGPKFESITQVDGMRDRTILVGGFSKAYAMTGWRVGYCIAPEAIAATVTLFNNNTFSCVSGFAQRAAIAALQGDDAPVQRMNELFRERRDVIVTGLNSLPGVSCTMPEGAFYAFPNVSRITDDDRAPRAVAAGEHRRGLPGRLGLRPGRQRLPALLLRDLGRRHPLGPRPAPRGAPQLHRANRARARQTRRPPARSAEPNAGGVIPRSDHGRSADIAGAHHRVMAMTADEVYVALEMLLDATAYEFDEVEKRLAQRFSDLENRLLRRIDGI